ncbi:cobalamin B12-binding domain-containing protein [Kitasatospora mediocidica]|uniref:cobalamin B12-binding domain-containing protein n=1 Tax=Kitasatospora mediocidica TaxID=58352 RepID=UPI00068FF189|nr:cobalamin-dependent protein [Kitasatospora mediocidica]
MSSDRILDVVVAGTESDSHTWNLVFLQLLLEDWGHRVENLGPCLTGAELAQACADSGPDLIVLSSVNGHGESDGLRAVVELRALAELAHTPIVIGGKLGTGRQLQSTPDATGGGDSAEQMSRRLSAAGFSAVFHDPSEFREFEQFVRSVAASGGVGSAVPVLEKLRTTPAS